MTEKEVCTAILENAKCKPFFVDFTGGITDQIGDDKMVQVDDVVGTMLWEAIQSPAENVSKSKCRLMSSPVPCSTPVPIPSR